MARINLLPWREDQRRERHRNFLVALGASAAGAIAVFFGVSFIYSQWIEGQNKRNAYLRTEIAKLDREIERIRQLEEMRERLIARKDVIERLQSSRSLMVHVFDQLVRTAPTGIRLLSVRQTGEELFIIGTSQSSARVSTYLRNLESSSWLHTPRLRIVEVPERNRDPELPYRFAVHVKVGSEEEPEDELMDTEV